MSAPFSSQYWSGYGVNPCDKCNETKLRGALRASVEEERLWR